MHAGVTDTLLQRKERSTEGTMKVTAVGLRMSPGDDGSLLGVPRVANPQWSHRQRSEGLKYDQNRDVDFG